MKIAQTIIDKMNTLSDQERSEVFNELLNGYCVACGAKGDWREQSCPCEPHHEHSKESTSLQLWLIYRAA